MRKRKENLEKAKMDRLSARLERKLNKIENIHEASYFKMNDPNSGQSTNRKIKPNI